MCPDIHWLIIYCQMRHLGSLSEFFKIVFTQKEYSALKHFFVTLTTCTQPLPCLTWSTTWNLNFSDMQTLHYITLKDLRYFHAMHPHVFTHSNSMLYMTMVYQWCNEWCKLWCDLRDHQWCYQCCYLTCHEWCNKWAHKQCMVAVEVVVSSLNSNYWISVLFCFLNICFCVISTSNYNVNVTFCFLHADRLEVLLST